ncbi:uncharacterized protein LOC110455427 [Mizuhopecten yessoensis]|uniref:uncharacterized protein LOC110455427 n=1 Tax=Mizuhopecten yessoensis TaxID=6573 RepID=UPI000B45AF05|nr:uncharacterized protein LOC110455427 [Mizuhopecten yessoensis]
MATAGQTAARKKGQITCMYHTGNNLEFVCENCSELACMKCVATRHRAHALTELGDIVNQKKSKMVKFIDELENNKLQNITEKIGAIEQQIENTSEYFDKLGTTVQEHGEELKQEIDGMIAESVSHCQKRREDNIRLLTDYKQCLKDSHKGLDKEIHECKTQLQEASDIELYDAEHVFESFPLELPDYPNLNTTSFEPPSHYRCYLEQALGTLVTNDRSDGQTESTVQLQPSTQASTSERSMSKARTTRRSVVKYKLLPQTVTLGKLYTKRIGNRICPVDNDEIWISYWDVLELLNKKGTVRRQFKFTVRITDISISPRTRNIWVCSDADSSIMECTQWAPSVSFYCNSKPLCLCVTIENHILVGMSEKVVRFSQHGKPLMSTKTSKPRQSLVRLPQKIAECRLTQNVAVVERQSHEENIEMQVIVIDKNFEELFRFKGDMLEYQPESKAEFDPWDVTFDNVGNLLIADCNNHSVLLVSSVGEFIRTVFTDERNTQAICLNKNHVLWAVFGDVVKRLQYLSA